MTATIQLGGAMVRIGWESTQQELHVGFRQKDPVTPFWQAATSSFADDCTNPCDHIGSGGLRDSSRCVVYESFGETCQKIHSASVTVYHYAGEVAQTLQMCAMLKSLWLQRT